MSSKFQNIKTFKVNGKEYHYYSLKELEKQGYPISRLPVSIRVILESLIRNLDGKEVHEKDIENLLKWNGTNLADFEIPFKVARVLMQEFPGCLFSTASPLQLHLWLHHISQAKGAPRIRSGSTTGGDSCRLLY